MLKFDNNLKNYIGLLEELKKLVKKIKSVVIDLDEQVCIYYDLVEKVGVSNLFILFLLVMGKLVELLVLDYEDKMYGYLKGDVVDVVVVLFEFI